MDTALAELLEKKDFEYITVKEICGAAGVNRSTFYLHYENTVDLLEETIGMLNDKFLSYFKAEPKPFIEKLYTCPEDELILIKPQYIMPYLEFVRDNQRIYSAAMRRPSAFRAAEAYGAMFKHIFNPILTRFSVPEEKREYIMTFYLNGIAAVVSEWLKNGCRESTDFISDLIIDCIPKKIFREER